MKRQMFNNFSMGLISDDFEHGSEMYLAMYAYEMYGDATRDNSFADLVALGLELENGVSL